MTTMVDIDEVLPDVLVQAPSCPQPFAIRQIRDAAREFCEQTRIWKETDEITVTTPESEGVISPTDAAIVAVEEAWLDGSHLEAKTVAWLDENVPNWHAFEEDSGSPRYVTQLAPNTVTIVPKATGTLRVRLILKPSRSADTLPEFLIDQYCRQIGEGAAGRVLVTQGREFTNPQLGAALLDKFAGEISAAQIKVAKGQTGGRLRTRGQYL